MLNLSQITEYYSAPERKFKRNILREYLQYKILEIIFNSKAGQKMSFLGGTALRIVYGSPRFSEDLDFDNFSLTEKDFAELADKIRVDLAKQGYRVEIKNIFKGAYRCYVKLPEVLFDNELSNLRQEKIVIQVDTAPHLFGYDRELKNINKFDVFTQIYATPVDIILSQKIYAALNRKRTKGRDFYDIVFLLSRTMPNYGYLNAKLGVKNGSDLKKMLLSKTADFDFETMAEDVKPFLTDDSGVKRVKLFLPYIKSLEMRRS